MRVLTTGKLTLALALVIGIGASGCGTERNAVAVNKQFEREVIEANQATGDRGDASTASALKQLEAGIGVNLKKAPLINTVSSAPPAELVSKDLVKGTGAVVKVGQTINVHYKFAVWGGSEIVDTSWTGKRLPTDVVLSPSRLIQGWIKGVPGMRVGGRRLLVIPPSLAYGSVGTTGVPANSTVILVVDVKSIKSK